MAGVSLSVRLLASPRGKHKVHAQHSGIRPVQRSWLKTKRWTSPRRRDTASRQMAESSFTGQHYIMATGTRRRSSISQHSVWSKDASVTLKSKFQSHRHRFCLICFTAEQNFLFQFNNIIQIRVLNAMLYILYIYIFGYIFDLSGHIYINIYKAFYVVIWNQLQGIFRNS